MTIQFQIILAFNILVIRVLAKILEFFDINVTYIPGAMLNLVHREITYTLYFPSIQISGKISEVASAFNSELVTNYFDS